MHTFIKKILPVACMAIVLNANAQDRATISGYITDAQSKETVLGATIFNSGTTQGTITNEFGFYSITLPKGNVKLSYSYVGYTPQQHNFNLTGEFAKEVE